MIVYQHKRLDDNSVFYIGIGGKGRPQSKQGRSDYWHRIVNKHGYSIEILFNDIPTPEAKSWERYLIDLYGRKDKKKGRLVNVSDGGESGSGAVRSEEFKRNLSVKKMGHPVSAETREKLRIARSGENGFYWGKKRPDHAAKLSKKVIDTKTGCVYDSAKICASIIGIEYRTLTGWLSGTRKNKTSLAYLNNIN